MTSNPEKERLQYLVAQYIAHKSTQEEIKELGLLLLDSRYEAHLFELMKGDWEAFASSVRLRAEHADELFGKIQSTLHKPVKTVPLFNYPKLAWRIAASIALIAVASLMLYQYRSNLFGNINEALVTIENPVGKRIQVTLPDSSRVWLNAKSTLAYPARFPKEKREVALQGEAFFEVFRNERKPFIITSHDISIKVLGTSFNVKAYQNEASEVTVATGNVQVEGANHAKVYLTANQQINFTNQNGFSSIKQVLAEDYMSWRDGTLVFDDKNLQDLTVILERWYGKKILLTNAKLKNCQLVGKHKNESLEKILSSLQFILDIEYEIMGDTVKISGSGCN